MSNAATAPEDVVNNKSVERHFNKAGRIFKEVLPLIKEHSIPITPENYGVWYEYAKGGNEKLNVAINNIINSGEGFSLHINHQLAARFISPHQTAHILGDIKSELEKLVASLLQEIVGMREGTTHFSGALGHCKDILENEPDAESIVELVATLVDEAKQIEASNETLNSVLSGVSKDIDLLKVDIDSLEAFDIEDHSTVRKDVNFKEAIADCCDCFLKHKKIFCLLLVDIDNFQQFNEKFGEKIGDRLLKFVDVALHKWTKDQDIVTRYFDDKFGVFLPNTKYDESLLVADRLREKICCKGLTIGGENKRSLGNVSVSIGVAMIAVGDDEACLISRTSKAVGLAKELGRNRVVGERQLFSRSD